MAIFLGRSTCRSRNDPSEARSSRTGQLRLEAGPLAGLGISKGACQGQGTRGMTLLSSGGVCSAVFG